MNDLSPPYPPDVLDPVPHTPPAGNIHDDDGGVIDDTLEANPNLTVDPSAFPGHLVPDLDYSDGPSPKSRLLVRSLTVGQALGAQGVASLVPIDPILLMPPDEERKLLIVRAMGAGIHDFAVAQPAAGTGFAYLVPAGHTFTIRNIRCIFSTDATVASRIVQVTVTDPAGNTIYKWGTTNTQTASQANTSYSFGPLMGQSGINGDVNAIIPDGVIIPAGYTLTLSAQGLQAGDQFASVVFTQSDCLYRIAGDKTDIYGAANLPAFANQVNEIRLDQHTGALWVYAPDTSGAFTVEAIAVSS